MVPIANSDRRNACTAAQLRYGETGLRPNSRACCITPRHRAAPKSLATRLFERYTGHSSSTKRIVKSSTVSLPALKAARVLDQLREPIRYLHTSIRAEDTYVNWVRSFIRFHDRRHPATMGGEEVEAFLSWLANTRHVAASTHGRCRPCCSSTARCLESICRGGRRLAGRAARGAFRSSCRPTRSPGFSVSRMESTGCLPNCSTARVCGSTRACRFAEGTWTSAAVRSSFGKERAARTGRSCCRSASVRHCGNNWRGHA